MVRDATNEDFDFTYSLYFHPQVNPFLLYEMMETEDFKPIFADLLAKEIVFIFEKDGEKVGMFVFFFTIFVASMVNALVHGWELTLVIMSVQPVLMLSMGVLAKVCSL